MLNMKNVKSIHLYRLKMTRLSIGLGVVASLFASASYAADKYVATNGNDFASGTIGSPYATITKAASAIGNGDTVWIRGGNYHEEVDLTGVSGTSSNPKTIKNYNYEVVTLDGTMPIDTTWTQHSGNIYKTTLSEDIWQLFVDDAHMTLARYPNAICFSDEMWAREGVRLEQLNADATNGHMVDNPNGPAGVSLADAGVSFNNCISILNLGEWETFAKVVSAHPAGADNFDYAPVASGSFDNALASPYFFEGGIGAAELVMLDMAQEWAYDESTKMLYLWADDGLNPNGRTIRGKNQSHAIIGDDDTKHITIDGINFFGTTFSLLNSDYCTVKNCTFDYPSFSKRALGSTSEPVTGGFHFDAIGGARLYGNELSNCEFYRCDGTAVVFKRAEGLLIHNNYFYQINYSCTEESGAAVIETYNCRDTVITRNTLDMGGPMTGINHKTFDDGYGAIIADNFLTRQCLQQDDGAAIQLYRGAQWDGNFYRNWMIDNMERDFRFDGNPGETNGHVYLNVAMSDNLDNAFRLKGDFHEFYNNTAIYANSPFNIAIKKGGNTNSITRNNAVDRLSDLPLIGASSNNYDAYDQPKKLHDLLRDPENWDFRPRADAIELIDQGVDVTTSMGNNITAGYNDAAPDIGAYEYGDTDYWIPGRITPQASMPIPPSGNQNVKLDADLMWLGGTDATAYNVYFGTTQGSPASQGSQTSNIFNPSTLASNTVYYWRIDTVMPTGTVTGVEWSLDTRVVASTEPALFGCDADTFCANNTTDNKGTANQLVIQDGTDSYRAYYRFRVTGMDNGVASATFKVTPYLTAIPNVKVYATDNANWDEMTITGANDPLTVGALLDTKLNAPARTEIEFDVSSFITNNGTYTLCVTTDSGAADLKVMSRESNTPPSLIVTPPNVNSAPIWNSSPFSKADATEGTAYTNSIAGEASDVDTGDTLTYSLASAQDWLYVAANGEITGTPTNADAGTNTFTISVSDGIAAPVDATLNIFVADVPPTPTIQVIEDWQFNDDAGKTFGNSTNSVAGSTAEFQGGGLGYAMTDGSGHMHITNGNSQGPKATLTTAGVTSGQYQLTFATTSIDLTDSTNQAKVEGLLLNAAGADLFTVRVFRGGGNLKLTVLDGAGAKPATAILIAGSEVDTAGITLRTVIDLDTDLADVYYTVGTGPETLLAGNVATLDSDMSQIGVGYGSSLFGANNHIDLDYVTLSEINPDPGGPAEIGEVSFGLAGTDAVVGWNGTNTATYAVQRRLDLAAGSWSNIVEDITGVDGVMSVTNATTEPQAFYRIILQ
jgi:hypothetical protein